MFMITPNKPRNVIGTIGDQLMLVTPDILLLPTINSLFDNFRTVKVRSHAGAVGLKSTIAGTFIDRIKWRV